MAIEYRLPYTAQEINERLRKTDEIAYKQDKLAFDSEPTEGSENLVKSGVIYTAIQNATPNLTFDETPTEDSSNPITSGGVYEALQNVGGGESYVAGDGIEIKDGVVRSTLGDFIGTETEGTFVEFYHEDSIEMGDQGDGTYSCGAYVELTNPIDINEKLTVKFELPNGTIKTFDADIIVTDYDEEEGVTYFSGLYNFIITDDGLVKVDENLDALYFEGGMTDEALEIALVTFEDYTGASITISQSKVVEHKVYATLPDNALTAGNLIKIENGVVSSTLGTEIVSIKESEFLNIDSVPSDCYDNDSGQTMYSGECDYVPTIGDKVDVEITLANSDDSISFNDVEVKAYGEAPCILTNSDQTIEDFDSNGIIKKDENLPSIFCMWIEEDGACHYTLISFEDITGASIKINGIATNVKVVKLPNEALTFDETPTEGSENLVNSGVVYEAIQNIYTSELAGKIEELTGKVEESTGKIDGKIEELTGKMIGKNGDGNGSEIFNDYNNSKASGDYSHAEGYYTTASGNTSHAEGVDTTASGDYSHAEGCNTTASGNTSHAEGYNTTASGGYSHAEGNYTTASGNISHAEGNWTTASGDYSHAEGYATNPASKNYTLSTSNNTIISDWRSRKFSLAKGQSSHVEGQDCLALGAQAHAEGYNTTASGDYSHSEGYQTTASEMASHAEGYNTIASDWYSHAEGINTKAYGTGSHVEGQSTIASGKYQHVQGRYNIEDTSDSKYAHIVGNGISEDTRSNAHTLDWDGNAWFAGAVEATVIILSSPNGTRFQITVDDNGTLSATEINE